MGRKKSKYNVKLTVEERSKLNRLTMGGVIGVQKLNRIKILLLADENHVIGGKTDKEIAENLGVSMPTVERTRRRYVEEGVEGALNEKTRSGRPPTITGEARAKITALACTEPMEGYAGWSLRLLASRAVELEIVERISHKTVGEILKKTR